MRFAIRPLVRLSATTGLAALLGGLISVNTAQAADPKPVDKPADPFGYSAKYDAELAKIGQITPAQFAEKYPAPKYLDKLTWDPTEAKYWKEFQEEKPKQAGKKFGNKVYKLDADELAKFKANGFVVSERLGGQSFGEVFYEIYNRDLPVFISTDCVLHAWHRSYDAMLEELEMTYLSKALDEILGGMAAQLAAANKDYGEGVLKASVTDADYFLAVGRSLLAGAQVKSHLKQDDRVKATLDKSANLGIEEFELFGRKRKVDFSQFKPRGHYEKSELLRRYFKAMMWNGRTDMRVAGGYDNDGPLSDPRELGSAFVLLDLLRKADQMDSWRNFDKLIQTFVGRTDSATFDDLAGLSAKLNIKSPADIKDLKTLENAQAEILKGKFGGQSIRGDVYISPFAEDVKVDLPRSFTTLGQKFVLDSFTTAKVVYDDIKWDDVKVQRRVPSGLDVAFAALGNSHVVPDLVARMTTPGRKFRDNLNYQHNLAAMRNTIDAQDSRVWNETIYNCWLDTLRTLSAPTTDDKFPEAMRTRAWSMKETNTQLASWTQLRHDTILYVKQSYTAGAGCEYPAGFVEPIVPFWTKLEAMATRAADLMEKTPFPDKEIEVANDFGKQTIKVKDVQKKQSAFFRAFAKQIAVLKGIADKEMNQEPLSAAETKVLEDVVQIQRGSGFTRYNGWYPKLFYKGPQDAGKWDALVADVHTDVPSPNIGDPGCVLHQGVGGIDVMLIAIDNGKDHTVYAGPTLSHYEFEMPGVSRKSDREWKFELLEGKVPPRPEWTKEYLVPLKDRKTRVLADWEKKRIEADE